VGTASVSHDYLLTEIGICVVIAWLLAVVAKLARQPLILAYLAAGVFVGPIGLGWIKSQESITTLSELGLIFLLFMIGLEIDLKKIRTAGKAIIGTSLIQVLGGCLLGVAFFKIVGFPLGGGKLDALYLAIAAALSSTVIIVKMLYDRRELNTLAGRITLGVLVMQDLAAILFLAVQPDLNNPAISAILLSFGKVGLLVAAALLASRFALPALFRAVAQLPELVLVGALAWCFLVCGLAMMLGLSREMGALIAGVAISTFPYTLDVTSRVTTLRDFFLTLFFVALGMTIPLPDPRLIGLALVLSGFVVASRYLTVLLPLHAMKLGHRVSFLPALNLCQISEFSLVIVALGLRHGHIRPETNGIVAYAFVLMAVQSSYLLAKSDAVLTRLSPLLARFGLRDLPASALKALEADQHHRKRIYLLGFYWTASSLLEELTSQHPELLGDIAVIDFNPHVNRELQRRGVTVIYGDISQRPTLLHAGVQHAEIIISTIPNALLKGTTNLRLVRELRELNPTAKIIAHAELLAEVPELYAAGANYVSVPRLIEAKLLCQVITAAEANLLEEMRAEVERDLQERQEVSA
jgi:Kef-type K+ transport system membrane component KefB